MLAFVHIEKAAGTTLIHILRRNFLLRHIDVRPLSHECQYTTEFEYIFSARDLDRSRRINPLVNCIAGHSVKPYGELAKAYPDIKFFTLLRNPLKRYVSQYKYRRDRMGEHYSFQEFLGRSELSNFQTRKIAGAEDLDAAKRILEQKFMLVGIVEEFDEFLVMLNKKLAPRSFNPCYTVKNETISKSETTQTFNEYQDQLVDNNQLDLALYDFVKTELIPEYRRWYGAGLKEDLVKFGQQNDCRFRTILRSYIDYAFRKVYIEPMGGVFRRINGLPAKGSY